MANPCILATLSLATPTSTPNNWRALLMLMRQYLRPHRLRLSVLLLLLLTDAAAQLSLPLLLTAFVDNAFVAGATQFLAGIAIWYLLASLLRQLTNSVQEYVSTDIGMRATNQLRSDLLKHTLGLDLAWHNATTPGALIERIDGDTTRLNTLLSTLLPQLLVNVLLMLGAMIAFFGIDWRAGLLVSALLPVALLIVRGLQGPIQRAYTKEREASSQLYGFVEERLAGTEDVRANGAVGHVMRRFFAASDEWGRHNIRAHVLNSMAWAGPSGVNALISVAVVALGVWLASIGSLTLGAVLALFRYTEVLSRPWFQLGRQIQDLMQAGASASRLRALAALAPGIAHTGTHTLPARALAVTLDHVTFQYADGVDPVLSDISLQLQPGRVLGLLGRTGSGKTSLTRLLTRLYEQNSGGILLDGVPLAAILPASLRERVAVVSQEVQVFSASVRDNVSLFDPGVNDAALWRALGLVGLEDWARALPQQLNTVLSAGSSGLSAGQAQLLAFARAFVREPGLVIMDEASSRLDPATEQQLERAVDQLLRGRTAIIIAHRLGTVQRADDILVLDGGRVAEFGEREALAADVNSQYYALLNLGAEEMLSG